MSVRFDGPGGLAVDHPHAPRRVLVQIFHLGYLHAHRRAGCERLVIEVNRGMCPCTGAASA